MLQELVLANFKTLQAAVRLPLGPRLTLLLGANNTGKSNALAALRLLGETARLQSLDLAVQALGGTGSLVTRGQARCHLRAHGVVAGLEFEQHLSFANPAGAARAGQAVDITIRKASNAEEIIAGKAAKVPGTQDLRTSSGRVYGKHPDSTTIFPRSGPGLVPLSQAEFGVYTQMVRAGGLKGDAAKALEGLLKSRNAGVNAQSAAKLEKLFRSRQ